MMKIGDVLTAQEVEVLKRDILKGKAASSELLINGLIYDK